MARWLIVMTLLAASTVPAYAAGFPVGLALLGLALAGLAVTWGLVGLAHLIRWILSRRATAQFASRFAQLPYPLPESVRFTGILLVVQGLLRTTLLLPSLLRYGLAVFSVYTTISLLLGIGGIAAGALALQRLALSRPLGLALCAMGVLYQGYLLLQVLGSVAYARLTPTTWFLFSAYFALYAAGLLVFAFAPYFRMRAIPGVQIR
jgi:hypothetical protein